MDPQGQFCHNPDCSDRCQSGRGNIRIPSRKEQRYCWSTCGRTFAATTGTPFYRLRTATDKVNNLSVDAAQVNLVAETPKKTIKRAAKRESKTKHVLDE